MTKESCDSRLAVMPAINGGSLPSIVGDVARTWKVGCPIMAGTGFLLSREVPSPVWRKWGKSLRLNVLLYLPGDFCGFCYLRKPAARKRLWDLTGVFRLSQVVNLSTNVHPVGACSLSVSSHCFLGQGLSSVWVL